MNTRSASLLLAVALACGTITANATPLGERASIELFAGADAMSGSFRGLNHAASEPGEIAFDHVDFDDAFHNRLTGGAELAFAIDSQVSAFARFAYSQFDGTHRNVATLFSDEGRMPVAAQFGDTTTRAIDLGARYQFMPDAKLRPFVGVSLGAARLSPLRAEVDSVNEGGIVPVELARESTVFEQRAETGLQMSPTRNFDLRLTVAADHVGAQRGSADPNLALLGLTDTRSDMRAHWDYPAELGAVWHF